MGEKAGSAAAKARKRVAYIHVGGFGLGFVLIVHILLEMLSMMMTLLQFGRQLISNVNLGLSFVVL